MEVKNVFELILTLFGLEGHASSCCQPDVWKNAEK